jgi:Fungal specific transcription factor domain
MIELFKRRLQIAKNISIDFDEVLPFYKQSANDGVVDDVDLTDTNTSFALPSKSSAEKLVQSFFANWHPLFPVLHRPSFQWDFEAMYTEKASKDPAHSAQMWLVLAIAARDTAVKVFIRFNN